MIQVMKEPYVKRETAKRSRKRLALKALFSLPGAGKPFLATLHYLSLHARSPDDHCRKSFLSIFQHNFLNAIIHIYSLLRLTNDPIAEQVDVENISSTLVEFLWAPTEVVRCLLTCRNRIESGRDKEQADFHEPHAWLEGMFMSLSP